MQKLCLCHPLATSFLDGASPPQKNPGSPSELHGENINPHQKHGKTQLQVYKNWITYNSVSVYSTHAHCLQLLSNSIPDTDLKIALTRSSWGKIPLHVPIHFHIRLKKKFKNISKWAIQSLSIYHTWIFQNTKIWLIFWIPVVGITHMML